MFNMVELRVRKVGNSLGVLFPKEFVAEKGLRLDQRVTVNVEPAQTIADTFGLLKDCKLTVEELMALADDGDDE